MVTLVIFSQSFSNFLVILYFFPDDLPDYAYEITTTAFKIDDQNHLIVNQANLDRDPPNENRLSFQVFVRELVEDNPKSSKPLTITVNITKKKFQFHKFSYNFFLTFIL